MEKKPLKPHSDHYIFIKGIRNKDSKILQQIYDSLLPSISSYIVNNNGTIDNGKEIFQKALEIMIVKAFSDSFVLPASFNAYFFGVCRNLWMKELSSKRKKDEIVRNKDWQEFISKEDHEQIIEKAIDGDRWAYLLDRTFKQLNILCQNVLGLYRKGKTAEDIAQILNIDSNAVYQRKNRCSKKWRKYMEADSDFSNCKPF